MKSKAMIKISSLLLVLVLCLMTLVGCTTNLDLPAKSAGVTGNGGLAVQKGEYIYFVNGYTAISDLKDGDNLGGNDYAAIYRAKLTDGELSYDEDGKLTNVDKIIDKVCGFDKTQIYIFDDYIYYATPNTEKVISSDSLSTNFEIIDFYRAKLDGTDRVHIYKTIRTSDSTKYAFYKLTDSDNVKLAVYDGTALYVIDTATKEVKTVSESVSSVALPVYADYNVQNNQISKGAQNVYYTRSGTEDEALDSGNVLCYAKLSDGEEQIISSGYYTYTVKQATNEALVYTKKSSYDLNANNYVIKYAFDAQGKLSLDVQNGGIQLDASANSEIYLCTFEEGNQTGIVVKNTSNKLAYLNYQTGAYNVLDTELELTPLCIYGTKIYAYDGDNSIYQIDYKTKAKYKLFDAKAEDSEFNKPYFSAKKNFSVCGGYVYYFATYEGDSETGYYLNRVKAVISEKYTPELLAVVQANHIKTETEEE